MDEAVARARRLIETADVVVSFSGAGLSAESGIDTFRDPDGIWNTIDPATVATPEAFERDPQFVTDWYAQRRRTMRTARPNAAHRALADAGIVNITQNIDGLLEAAGATDVIHLHGTMWADRCHAECGHREQIESRIPSLRACPHCGSWMRPDVVLFGELLPERAWQRAALAALASDVMIVIGTSAEVYPAAGLIDAARQSGASIVVVNVAGTVASRLANVEIRGAAGDVVPRLFGNP